MCERKLSVLLARQFSFTSKTQPLTPGALFTRIISERLSFGVLRYPSQCRSLTRYPAREPELGL
jgi:hypothetical protein